AQEQINSWLETLGIRYNIAQNGYICLGKLFGDAIIQWGINKAGLENPIPFNISFTKTARVLAIPNVLSTNLLPSCVQFVNDTASVNRAILDVRDIDGKSQNGLYVQWFAIGA
ncbi:gp53-like domain-containing protein, partial [Megamonas funiformis]|uniref:gp53-like domain-containing protein n=1 Tax=Megamonas funiformis TaxID=437897 RepID=UPI00195608EB